MVNKLTKRKLKLFAVYDLWKVAVVSVLACAILLLAFNFVAKKPSDGQEFKILIDKTVNMGDDINDLFENLFTKAPEQGGFSYFFFFDVYFFKIIQIQSLYSFV